MKSTKFLLSEDIEKTFFSYLIPAVFGMLGTSLYVLGDTMIVGRFLGAQGLAALNISIPVINLFTGMGLLFGVGGATCISINKGRDDNEKNNKIFTTSMLLAFLTGILFFIFRVFFIDEFVLFMGATENTFSMAKDYLGIMLIFSGAFIINAALNTFVRNDGSPKIAMASMLISSIFNVILDYIFIVTLGLGLWGGALATVLSPILGIMILSLHFIRKKNSIKITRIKLRMSIISRITSNGFSSLIIELSIGLSIFAFNLVILGLTGDIGVSAYSIIANLSLIFTQILAGVGQAIQPIVSINYGAKLYDRSESALRLGLKTSLILGAIFFAMASLIPKQMASIFITEHSPELMAITIRGIKLYFSAFLFIGINIVLTAYSQAIELSRVATLMSVLKGFVFLIGILLVIPNFIGLDGVWISLPLSELLTCILFFVLHKTYNILGLQPGS